MLCLSSSSARSRMPILVEPGSRVMTTSKPWSRSQIGEQPRLGGLAGALAALQRDEHAVLAGRGSSGAYALAAQRGHEVADQRDAAAVVHLPVRDQPDDRSRRSAAISSTALEPSNW